MWRCYNCLAYTHNERTTSGRKYLGIIFCWFQDESKDWYDSNTVWFLRNTSTMLQEEMHALERHGQQCLERGIKGEESISLQIIRNDMGLHTSTTTTWVNILWYTRWFIPSHHSNTTLDITLGFFTSLVESWLSVQKLILPYVGTSD